jgi:hypothetical protein
MMIPQRQIRATYDEQTIVVYQAYRPEIADAAVRAQRFVEPFSYSRMTWVKPSFLWMMERCGWATKVEQERVLAISLLRVEFDRAVANAVPSDEKAEDAPIRVQWDPERDLRGQHLDYRSLQLGLGLAVCKAYATEWITRIDDVTPLVRRIDELRGAKRWNEATELLPMEHPYP